MKSIAFPLLALTGAIVGLTGCLQGGLEAPPPDASGPAKIEGAVSTRVAGVSFTPIVDAAMVHQVATDISYGADGTLYRVRLEQDQNGNFSVDKWLGGLNGFSSPVPGGKAVEVAGGAAGIFLARKADNSLYNVVGSTWTSLGTARDMAIYGNSYCYKVNTTPLGEAYSLSKRVGNSWTSITGWADRVAVAPNGDLWALNHGLDHTVWKRANGGSGWVQVTGKRALEITISHDGTVYVLSQENFIGGQNAIYRYDAAASTWRAINGAGWRIAGGPGKTLVVREYTYGRLYISPDPPLL